MAETAWGVRVGKVETPEQTTEGRKPWSVREQPLAMFYVHFENGRALGFQYFNMISPEFLGDRVKVYFDHATVTIKGRNLWELFLKLLEHKVQAIREQHEHEGLVSSLLPYIEEITLDDAELKAITTTRAR